MPRTTRKQRLERILPKVRQELQDSGDTPVPEDWRISAVLMAYFEVEAREKVESKDRTEAARRAHAHHVGMKVRESAAQNPSMKRVRKKWRVTWNHHELQMDDPELRRWVPKHQDFDTRTLAHDHISRLREHVNLNQNIQGPLRVNV